MTAISKKEPPKQQPPASSPSKPRPTSTGSSTASTGSTGSPGLQPTNTQSGSQPAFGGIPQNAPFRSTGSPPGSTGPKTTDSPKKTDEAKASQNGKENPDYRKEGSTPKSGKEWMDYLKGASQPKTGKEWLNYLKNGYNGAKEFVKAIRDKVLGNVANPTWMKGVLAAFASNSQRTVGWFGGAGTAMSDWVLKNGGKNILGALSKHIGKSYPGFPANARTQGWQSKVGDKNFLNSIFNPTKSNVDKGLKTFYAGFAKGGGGDNWAFAKGTGKFNKALENAIGDKNLTTMRRNQATIADMKQVFAKIADYARKNPNKPVTVLAHWNSHGNRSGGGKEGAAKGYDLFGSETMKKQLVAKYFGNLKNVAVVPIIECCHAGAQIS